jgi:aspartate kinase
MVVLKFGGTSIADTQPIRRVASIVARQAGRRAVVVSALAGVTDRLAQVATLARQGKPDMAYGVLDGLVRRHEAVARALLAREDTRPLLEFLQDVGRNVASLVAHGTADRSVAPWVSDAILAAGELMLSRLIAAALNAGGVSAVWIDPREVIRTDDAHGCAAVDLEGTAGQIDRYIGPVLAEGCVPVTGGFVGATAAANLSAGAGLAGASS